MELTAPILKELLFHPFKHWISWLLIIVFLVISHGATWIIALKKGEGNINNTQQIVQYLGVRDNSPTMQIQTQFSCQEEKFNENKDKWDTRYFREEKDGFWCVKKDWKDPVMWYASGLNPGFKELDIEYETRKNDKSKVDNPQSLIMALGREKPLFKLWVPEGGNLQLFRFAKNLDLDAEEASLSSEPAESLSDPVKLDRTNSLFVKPSHMEGNDLFLNFTLNYTSAVTLKGEHDTIPKRVKLPVSDIPSSDKKIPFGVGTYVGNCIKIVSYKICE